MGIFVINPVVRKRALQALPIMVLVLTTVLVVVQCQQFAELKQKAFESLVREKQKHASTQLKRWFDPITTNLTIARNESERLEFKSTVRWNFKAGRQGKARRWSSPG